MALADRDYYIEPERSRSASRITPVVKALLIINAAIFLLDYMVLQSAMGYPPILYFGAFTIKSGLHDLRIWEFITFQFLHGSFLHILFNSFGLYFFGPWMERHLGARCFLIYYLLCGAAGAGFYTLISYLGVIPWDPIQPLVGASAGIYGIFMGVAIIAPNLRVQLLIPPIPMSMRSLAIVLLLIATAVILFNLNNAGGEAGHLGGAILGLLMMRFLPWFRRDLSFGSHRPRPRKRYASKLSPRSTVSEDTEIDAILDKVSAQGFQSLTDEEKAILKKAAGEK